MLRSGGLSPLRWQRNPEETANYVPIRTQPELRFDHSCCK
jgi:hypothetical protein